MQNIQSNDNQYITSAIVKPAPKKSVFLVMVMIVGVMLVLGIVLAFACFRLFAGDSTSPSGVIFEEVKRGVFVHEVTDRGNVESAQNEDIRCQVESSTGTLIVWIIPEGTLVEEGEVICRLDPSNLDERTAKQEITTQNSKATLVQSEANLKIAVLSLEEYEKGTFPKEEQTIKNRILKAEEDWSRATETRGYTEKLLAQGYVTELQLKADKAKEEQLQNDLVIAKLELEVLQKITKEKKLEELNADIVTAEAKRASDKLSFEIENTRWEYLKTQLANCTIRATKAGQVVYATPNTPWRRDNEIIKEGNSVRDRQVVIRLPDPRQMQVAGMVNEASVSLVKVGQPATITLEAMPSHVFTGVVKQVNDFPEPDGMMGSMTKEYKTIVSMDDLDSLPPNLRAGIRPGLTAQIRIDVTDPNNEASPILVPVQTLFEHAGKYYCITYENGKWEKIEVEVGATNDKEVIIKSGLTEGQRVVQGAWRYITHVLTEEERTGAREFGVGGARQRRGGPGGPGGGAGEPGAPGGPSGFGGPGEPGNGSAGGPPRGPAGELGSDFARPGGGPPGEFPGNAPPRGQFPDPGDGPRNNRPDNNPGFQPPASRFDGDMRDTEGTGNSGGRGEGGRRPPGGGGDRPNRPPVE
ncbi:MAG: HlyD family efflux transporter periplasmic adaptor subunit [Planctomycetaceae bacterium]|nr:HlyD family efflux transporter periplasmic adaptor subunit [Planctomycetaceae bacterium]